MVGKAGSNGIAAFVWPRSEELPEPFLNRGEIWRWTFMVRFLWRSLAVFSQNASCEKAQRASLQISVEMSAA
jgi:hypothetical protein